MNNFLLKIFQFGIIVIISVLVVTNPGADKYELYASRQLVTYFKNDLCPQTAEIKEIQNTCRILIDTIRPQIKMILNKNTRQENFLLFSLYHTDFSLSLVSLEYDFTTLGIVDRFFTKSEEAHGMRDESHVPSSL